MKQSVAEVDPPKIKLRVRLDVHGLFTVESAEQVENYVIEEEVPVAVEKPKAADGNEEKKQKTGDAEADAAANGDSAEKKDGETMETDEAPKPAQGGEGEGDDAAKEADEAKPPAEEKPKTEKKQKRKVRRRFLAVEESLPGALSKKELDDAIENEQKMVANDKLQVETAEAKNALETFIYSMRDKLQYQYKDYASDAEREAILPVLQETEDWLYDDGDEETKSVYVRKLADLESKVSLTSFFCIFVCLALICLFFFIYSFCVRFTIQPPYFKQKCADIVSRYQEAEVLRPEAIKALESLANEYSVRAKTDLPDYAHISDEDKAKVVKACDEALEWMRGQIDEQLKASKAENPKVKAADFDARRLKLEATVKPIMSQPKPAPKKEEKKEEAKDGEKKDGGEKNEGEQKKEGDSADADAKKADDAKSEPVAEDKADGAEPVAED